MLRENLLILRNVNGYTQEEIAEKIGVSRQAYAKWEKGASVPGIDKCIMLAKIYGTSLDALTQTTEIEGIGALPPAPQGKHIWGSVNVGERGQIVIPKEVREQFDLTGGRRLIVLSDDDGIALLPAEKFEENIHQILALSTIQK